MDFELIVEHIIDWNQVLICDSKAYNASGWRSLDNNPRDESLLNFIASENFHACKRVTVLFSWPKVGKGFKSSSFAQKVLELMPGRVWYYSEINWIVSNLQTQFWTTIMTIDLWCQRYSKPNAWCKSLVCGLKETKVRELKSYITIAKLVVIGGLALSSY